MFVFNVESLMFNIKIIHISPHCEIITGIFGLLFGPVGTFSIFLTTSMPSRTRPNTTCLPSRKSHFWQVMKN